VKWETIKEKQPPKHERNGVGAAVGEVRFTPGPGAYDGVTSNPRATVKGGTLVDLGKQVGRDKALLSRIPTRGGATLSAGGTATYVAPSVAVAIGNNPTSVTTLARSKGGRLSRVITDGIRQLISITARLIDLRDNGELSRHVYDKVEHELFSARQYFRNLWPWLPIPKLTPKPPTPTQPSPTKSLSNNNKNTTTNNQKNAKKPKQPKKGNDDAMVDVEDNDDQSSGSDNDFDMAAYDDDYDTMMTKHHAAEQQRLEREANEAERTRRQAEDDEMAIYDDPKPPTSILPPSTAPIDEVAALEEELQHLASNDVQSHRPPSAYRMK
jgi:hypothetical protein